MKKRVAAILAIIVATIGIGVGAIANQFMIPAVPGSDVRVSGCVIRLLPTHREPQIHANAAHACAGVTSADFAPNGRLRVRQSLTDAHKTPIVVAIAQVDETLAAKGILVGPSGGTGVTEYQFYDTKLGRTLNLRNTADWNRVTGANSNLWLGWIHLDG